MSITYPNNQNIDYDNDGIGGSPGYCDPLYSETHILTTKSDIYSLGVILFELLCGTLAYTDRRYFLATLVKGQYDVERPDVFERIKEQIESESLVTFTTIAFKCLHDDREEPPTASMVVVQLQQALEFQEAYENAQHSQMDHTPTSSHHEPASSTTVCDTPQQTTSPALYLLPRRENHVHINQSEGYVASLHDRLDAHEATITNLVNRLDAREATITTLVNRLDARDATITTLVKRVDKQETVIAMLLAAVEMRQGIHIEDERYVSDT
ncbi:uncharacterized protein [Rutidosis leptorrhynchoides]|uniref:uncharacterized protein n=1 Tax=Rutidosis leptorrhynchoides TaxID=125765 RepID=UPI003A9947B0